MHIGIASPLTVSKFSSYLDPESTKRACKIEGLRAPAVDSLVEEYLRLGHSVTVYTLANEVNEAEFLHGERLNIFIGSFKRANRLKAISFFEGEVRSICRGIELSKRKPDVFHAHWSYEFAKGVLRASDDVPVFVTVRDWAPSVFKRNRSLYRFSRLILNNHVIKNEKCNLISNSPYIKERLAQAKGLESTMIPNALSCAFCSERKEVSKNPQAFRFLSVSNSIDPNKNIGSLLLAFNRLREKDKNNELILVGKPFYPSNPSLKVWRAKGLLTNVILIPELKQSELIDVYDQSDVLVHPSLEESFGNVLIEAMARKIPVIGGENSGAVPYVLGFGDAGFLCNVQDTKELADKMYAVKKDTPLKKNIIKNAHKKVRHEYSARALALKTIELYESALRNKNESRSCSE